MEIWYPIPEQMPAPRARFIQIMHTAHALASAGARVVLVTDLPKTMAPDELPAAYGLPPHPRLEVIPLPLMNASLFGQARIGTQKTFALRLLIMLARTRRRSARSVIFVRHLKLGAFLIRWQRLHDRPVVYEAHEVFTDGAERALARSRLAVQERTLLTHSRLVVFISDELRKRMPEAECFLVAPDGAPAHWLCRDGRPRGQDVLYAGGMYRWKGVDVLLEAAARTPGLRFRLVGGGARLSELQEKARSLGIADRVTFTGPVPHAAVPAELDRAGLAVLPNIPEGRSLVSSPLKLFEYLARGLPVIASDLPVFREVLTHEHNALLFPPGDGEALAECIRRLAADSGLADLLSAAARETAEAYTYDCRAVSILTALEEVFHD